MPRLTLDLPDELRGAGRRSEGGDDRSDAVAEDHAERTLGGQRRGTEPRVVRWHRCWAREDQ